MQRKKDTIKIVEGHKSESALVHRSYLRGFAQFWPSNIVQDQG